MTAINLPYLPGLKALHNSMLRNSPDCEMACLVYGDAALIKEVSAMGIKVVDNPAIPAQLPTSTAHPVTNEAMYARLLVPWLFNEDSVWMDADQVILKPMNPLFEIDYEGKPCACVPSTALDKHVIGCPKQHGHLPGVYAGLIVFNHLQWKIQQITEQCFAVMNENAFNFKYVVQSVLGYVLLGNFKRLAPYWQTFGNRSPSEVNGDSRVVHWHGLRCNPWSDAMPNLDLWKQYA